MRVIVLGSDIFAYVCAYIFKNSGLKVLMVDDPDESEEIVEDFIYVRSTSDTLKLMQELDVLYSVFIVRGGIMLHENVCSYPKHFMKLGKDRIRRIRYDYYRKTRKICSDNVTKAMARPFATKSKTAIRADVGEFCSKLAKSVRILKKRVFTVSENNIELYSGQKIYFDKLVVSLPLWKLRKYSTWEIPHVLAMRSQIAKIISREDLYEKYDFIYTPYTPENYIHFIWNDGEFFFAEASGIYDRIALQSDLNFLFKDGWYLEKIYKDLKGYTLPFEFEIHWPKNIYPVSPHSLWNDDLGIDDALREAKRLVKEWYSKR